MVLRVIKGALVHLDAHTLGREFLRRTDVLGQGILARGVAATIADAKRQVDAHVGVVRKNGVPDLGGHAAHAGQHDLVALRHASERARARDVGVLERRGGADDAVIELARGDLERREALRRASRRAQAALAARIGNLDAALGHVDGLHRADVAAERACTLIARLARDARVGARARTLLVVRRVPGLDLLGFAERAFATSETGLDSACQSFFMSMNSSSRSLFSAMALSPPRRRSPAA